MKTILLLALALGVAACSQQNMDERAGADNAIEAKKDQIDTAADAAKDQIKADAKAQEEKIEAQAKAAKAELEATEAQAEAQAAAQNKDLEAQAQRIEEAAGAESKQQITAEATAAKNEDLRKDDQKDFSDFRTALGLRDQDSVEVHIEDGKATLKGDVDSEARKNELEQKARSFQGVTEVENKLEVKVGAAREKAQSADASIEIQPTDQPVQPDPAQPEQPEPAPQP